MIATRLARDPEVAELLVPTDCLVASGFARGSQHACFPAPKTPQGPFCPPAGDRPRMISSGDRGAGIDLVVP